MQRRDATKRHPPLVWDDARLFLGILRAGSLAGGARALGVDKSTLSRRVARMERALGASLFVRSADGLRPSSVAERIRSHAETIESEVRAMVSAGIAASDEVRGPVRIATTEGMAPRIVRGGLLDLRTTHPALELELLGGNRPVDLGAGEADLAIRVTPTTGARLVVRVLGRWSLALFASPRYLHARGTPRSSNDLSGHDVLVPSGELGRLPEAVLLAKARGARVTLRSSSLPALVEAAVLGYGLVALTRPWGESVDGLAFAVALDSIPPRPAWLVATPEALTRPAVRLVADRIIEAFRGVR